MKNSILSFGILIITTISSSGQFLSDTDVLFYLDSKTFIGGSSGDATLSFRELGSQLLVNNRVLLYQPDIIVLSSTRASVRYFGMLDPAIKIGIIVDCYSNTIMDRSNYSTYTLSRPAERYSNENESHLSSTNDRTKKIELVSSASKQINLDSIFSLFESDQQKQDKLKNKQALQDEINRAKLKTKSIYYDTQGQGYSLLPSLNYDKESDVISVCVKIKVDKSGIIVESIPGIEGSTTKDENLLSAAREASYRVKFEPQSDGPEFQYSIITYYFISNSQQKPRENMEKESKGISYYLEGRRSLLLQAPEYGIQAEGKVVVGIKVDRSGKVINATAGMIGTTTLDENLLKFARGAAIQSKFDSKFDAPLIQDGIITYNFVLK